MAESMEDSSVTISLSPSCLHNLKSLKWHQDEQGKTVWRLIGANYKESQDVKSI